LRNTLRWLKSEAKFGGTSMQTFYYSLPISLFVLIRSWISIAHAETHGVVEQNRNLSGGGGHCFGFSDSSRKASIKGAQRSASPSHCDSS
uniref:hypothetical protein n=1 Tax=Pseudomonas bohemica TaxID=2044872 RepID=UPI001F406A5F